MIWVVCYWCGEIGRETELGCEYCDEESNQYKNNIRRSDCDYKCSMGLYSYKKGTMEIVSFGEGVIAPCPIHHVNRIDNI